MTKNYFYNIKEIYKLVTNVVLGYSSLKLINDRCESVCMSGTQKIHYIIKYIRNTNYFRFLTEIIVRFLNIYSFCHKNNLVTIIDNI